MLIHQPFRHFTYVTAHSRTFLSLYIRHRSFSNPSVALSTSQLILLPFFRFSYVTGSSLTSPGEPHMVMTSYDACNSGTSRVLTVASLQRLKMEALIPAPADCEVPFLHLGNFIGYPTRCKFVVTQNVGHSFVTYRKTGLLCSYGGYFTPTF